jgi:hypothetical protein
MRESIEREQALQRQHNVQFRNSSARNSSSRPSAIARINRGSFNKSMTRRRRLSSASMQQEQQRQKAVPERNAGAGTDWRQVEDKHAQQAADLMCRHQDETQAFARKQAADQQQAQRQQFQQQQELQRQHSQQMQSFERQHAQQAQTFERPHGGGGGEG